jgi:hypothetical protein
MDQHPYMYDRRLPANAKILLWYLRRLDSPIVINQPHIARALNIALRTVRTNLFVLELQGYVLAMRYSNRKEISLTTKALL